MKTKSKSKKTQPKAAIKPTLVAFLLDRSGSMSSHLDETIGGFNSYIRAMKKNDKEAGGKGLFTLALFDSTGITTQQTCVPVAKAMELNKDTYRPGAYTPLYDAIGRTIRETEKRCKGYRVLFVTQTDGLENASVEWGYDKIRELIFSKEKDDAWTFAYVGMGMSGWAQAKNLAANTVGATNVMHYAGATSAKAFTKLAESDKKYRASGIRGQSVNCSVANFYEGDEDQSK